MSKNIVYKMLNNMEKVTLVRIFQFLVFLPLIYEQLKIFLKLVNNTVVQYLKQIYTFLL